MRTRISDGLRVIFAGGGTGGHIMPGAATAQALCELLPGSRCLFMCTDRRSELHCRHAIAGFELAEIPAARWRGALQKLRFAATSLAAARRSIEIFSNFRPHVLVGLGGYSCVVPVLLARALGVPTMIFESNAVPGRVIRALAPLVDCVQLQWPTTKRRLRARHVLICGNPVRACLLQGDRRSARARLGLHPDRCTLLATGGSQGALALNRLLISALQYVAGEGATSEPRGLQVLHLTGSEHLAEARGYAPPPGLTYQARAFVTQMEDAYAAADLVLSRAGGSTLAELTAVGLPSILIPYPHASDNHQSANAALLAEAGAAVVLSQRKLTPRKLGALIADLVHHPERIASMAARATALGRPDAAHVVAAQLASMAGFKTIHDHDTAPQDYQGTSEPLSASRAA